MINTNVNELILPGGKERSLFLAAPSLDNKTLRVSGSVFGKSKGDPSHARGAAQVHHLPVQEALLFVLQSSDATPSTISTPHMRIHLS